MKIKIIIFAAILLLCNLAYGQTVSKDSYEKVVDYLNCRAVELSLKVNTDKKDANGKPIEKNQDNYDKYVKDFPCNENISSEKIIGYLNKIGYKDTKTLSEKILELKNQFREDSKPEQIVNFLSEEVFDEKSVYKELKEFANKRNKDTDFDKFKGDLRKDLTDKLSVGQTTDVNLSENTSITNPEQNKNTSTNQSPSENEFSFINLALWIAWLILIAVTGYLFKLLRDFDKELNELRLSHNSLKGSVKDLSKTPVTTNPSSRSYEINDLKKEMAALKAGVDFLLVRYNENQTAPSEPIQRRQDTHYNNEPIRGIYTEPTLEVFYLSTPNEDGTFDEKYANSSYREGASIYKFTKISNSEAEFQIDERDSSVKLALQYPDKTIDPVCEAQNAYDAKADRIVTIQGGLGKATLEGDRWKVTKKALIRYE